MTNKKSTKRALLMSLMAMLLCVTMLVGTTFAWFTDSVTSTGNIIKSGTLVVGMYWAEGQNDVPAADSEDWKDASDTQKGPIFNYDKWEPGYVAARHIKISNEGTLALKYQVNIIAEGEVTDLADVIDVYYADPAAVATRELTGLTRLGTLTEVLAGMADSANGVLLAGASDTITLVLKMQETAGNEYQDKSIGASFSIQLVATQYTEEADSFGSEYDSGALYPVADNSQLAEAIANAQEGDTIILSDGKYELPADLGANNITIVGAGDGTVISAAVPAGGSIDAETAAINVSGANITLKNLYIDAADGNSGSLVLSTGENLTVENCTFDMSGTNSAGVYLFDSDSATIKNCTFIDGYKSIYVNGKDVDTETDTDKLVIENCSFKGTYALHVGGSTNVIATNCDFNGIAITLYNGTATFTDCNFNDGSYNQLLNYYAPVTFENCYFGSDFVYALRQAVTEIDVVVNNATYATEGNTFVNQCGWSIATSGSLTDYTVTEDGVATDIPTTQRV